MCVSILAAPYTNCASCECDTLVQLENSGLNAHLAKPQRKSVCVWGIEWSAPVRPQQDIRNLFSNSKMYMSLTTPLLCACVCLCTCVCKKERERERTLWGGPCQTHASRSALVCNHGTYRVRLQSFSFDLSCPSTPQK